MMQAAFIHQVGPWSNIQYGELPRPVLKDNQVLVKTAQVVVDPIDIYIRSGHYPFQLPLPYIIGRDMWGTVESAGTSVKKFKAGDRVWSNNQGVQGRQGTFAQVLAIDENLLYPLPAGVEGVEVVTVCHSALTAYTGLFQKGCIKFGQTLFVNGGAGNVGSAIIQMARLAGAKIITTAGSEEKIRWCKEIGADCVINYKTEDVHAAIKAYAPDGVDMYWDTTREPDFEKAVHSLAFKGRIILMAGSTAKPPFPVGPFYSKSASLIGFTINRATAEEMQEGADAINRLLKDRKLKGRIYKTLTLKEAAEAHRIQESEKDLWGKILLNV